MLEHGAYPHVDDLVDLEEIVIDHRYRDNVSHAAKTTARRVASEYWVVHGYDDAWVQAATSLEMVRCVYLCFFECLWFLFGLPTFAIFSLGSRS